MQQSFPPLPPGSALFGRPDGPTGSGGWSLALTAPREILVARELAEVRPLLARADAAARGGCWVALMLAYEAAPAFDPALRVQAPGDFPLAWAGVYDRAAAPLFPPQEGALPTLHWRLRTGRRDYARAFAHIQEQIRLGETYQVNYTLRAAARFEGCPSRWYAATAARSGQEYCAHFHLGRHQVLSFSPELFLRRQGNTVSMRPMKGTMPRGATPEQDREQRERLRHCPKNRAENVMIVDLIRNDLGRVALPDSVRVPELFRVETYPTVLQLTSLVTAQLPPHVGLAELFGAVFPCGSVTGAPKVRTMELIRELEPDPRLVYCGALGYLQPGGDCVFNVPIRTVLLETEDSGQVRASCGIGGGVTADSREQDEFAECVVKLRFLRTRPDNFRLLETLRYQRGRFFLLAGHLRRLQASAAQFGFACDPMAVRAALEQALAGAGTEPRRVRLLLERQGRVTVEHFPLALQPATVLRAGLARDPVDSADLMLRHKTDRRVLYDAARAGQPDLDEVLLWNERGELTECSTANLVLRLDGTLVTPPISCGLLPGVLRGWLLAWGGLRERVLRLADLERAEAIWAVNALRGWRPLAWVAEPEDSGPLSPR